MRVKLGEVFDLQMGKTPARNNPDYWNGDKNWVSISDLGNAEKYIDRTKEKITDKGVTESGIKIVPKGTVIMSFKLTIGKTAITAEDMYTNEAIMAFLDKKVCEMDTDYLYHLFSGFDWSAGTNKAVMGLTLNKATLSKKEIPLPPLAEQREIAAVLDKVCDLISLRRKELERLDLMVKARFVEMFGNPIDNSMNWQVTTLSSLILTANNGMARRGNDIEGNIVLRLVELQNGYIDYSSPNRIILSEVEKRKYRLINRDFLFARVNGNPENVGRCAVFSNIKEPVYYNDHIIRVHFDENCLNGSFASILLNSDYGKKQMKGQVKTSAGQYTISQDGIGRIKIVLPPIELQKQFADFVAEIDKLKLPIQRSLDTLEVLKKSLMQKYFN